MRGAKDAVGGTHQGEAGEGKVEVAEREAAWPLMYTLLVIDYGSDHVAYNTLRVYFV